MKKTVTSLFVSSLILTSVVSAAEFKKPFCVSDNVTAKCAYTEKFSPDSCFKKFYGYLGQCNTPSVPETDESLPEIDTNVPDSDIPESNTENKLAIEVLELVNKERKAAGLSELVLDSSLSKVAQSHSLDMAKNNYFSHTNLNGLSPFDRLKNAGILYNSAGENIAMGYKTPQSVVSGWMNSSGHRANILNSSFNKMGLGTAPNNSGGYYWTQIFTN